MQTYRGWWPIVTQLPPGWRIDKTCGSPLAGHVFIHNGRSVLRGQQRALLRIATDAPPPDGQQLELFA